MLPEKEEENSKNKLSVGDVASISAVLLFAVGVAAVGMLAFGLFAVMWPILLPAVAVAVVILPMLLGLQRFFSWKQQKNTTTAQNNTTNGKLAVEAVPVVPPAQCLVPPMLEKNIEDRGNQQNTNSNPVITYSNEGIHANKAFTANKSNNTFFSSGPNSLTESSQQANPLQQFFKGPSSGKL